MIFGVRERLPSKYRIAYLTLYVLLIAYPIYRVSVGVSYLSQLYGALVAASSFLIILGIVYTRSELIVLYYVFVSIVFKICMVKEPSIGEFIIYSLVILHGDMISKILVYGIGYRRIRTSVKGLLLFITVVLSLLALYMVITYLATGLFINLSSNVVEANVLTELTFGKVLATRFGSLLLLLLVVICVLYILSHYVSGIVNDVLSLNRAYARDYIRSSIGFLWKLLYKGGSWHQKLFFRVTLLFILFFTWILILPLYFILAEFLPALFGPHLFILSLATSLLISALVYTSLRRLLSKLLRQKASLELPKLRLDKPSDAPLILSIVMLTAYLVSLILYYKYDYGILYNTLMRSFGLGQPYSDQYLSSIVGVFEKAYINISDYFVDYCEKYIGYLVSEFEWLTRLIKSLIKLLWGR